LAVAALAVAPAARASADAEPETAADAASGFTVHELEFGGHDGTKTKARAYVPRRLASTEGGAWPVAVLLHGYAQALSMHRALAAWGDEYDVLDAYRRLERGDIAANPAVSEARAEAIRRELAVAPFSGMVLVTPITPVPYFQKDLERALSDYSDFIHDELLPRVAELAPISTAPEHIGLSGVSMGALVGLELMWRFPERFGAYCGLEIAIGERDAYRYAGLLEHAFGALDPGVDRPIRIVTATKDTYRWPNQTLHEALVRRGLESSIELGAGAHDAAWMQQAGSLESLLWLDRALHRS
jgi:pimeloyl-ACP methyl ester carboxylesterase